MANPEVTIILPVFNGASYLSLSIESVLNQKFSNWELLVINDGSTDNSKEIILCFKDARIKYFEQPNQGVSAARNVGLAQMQGEYFCFLDADDVLPSNSLSSRLRIFEEDKNISFVDGQVKFIDKNGNSVSGSYHPKFKGNPLKELVSLSDSCFVGQSWMIKRKPSATYRFNENMTHAEDLAFYISTVGDGIYSYTEEVTLQYRKHDSSAMTNLLGLENGYIQLIKIIGQTHPQISTLVTRLKAAKIMFLSHLFDGKSITNAFRSIFRILGAK